MHDEAAKTLINLHQNVMASKMHVLIAELLKSIENGNHFADADAVSTPLISTVRRSARMLLLHDGNDIERWAPVEKKARIRETRPECDDRRK